MKWPVLILIAPLLAACQSGAAPPAPGAAASGGDACGASRYAADIGRPMGDARFPADVDMRLINPGEMVTMDFSPARLNVEVDEAGKIVAITCG